MPSNQRLRQAPPATIINPGSGNEGRATGLWPCCPCQVLGEAFRETALFCCLDDFARLFEEWEPHHLIPSELRRNQAGKLSRAEMLFIMMLFHISAYKDFKHFRLYGIRQEHRGCFAELPGYGRFVSLPSGLLPPFYLLLHDFRGKKPASPLPIAPSRQSVAMHGSAAAGSSKDQQNEGAPPWAGSLASSSICLRPRPLLCKGRSLLIKAIFPGRCWSASGNGPSPSHRHWPHYEKPSDAHAGHSAVARGIHHRAPRKSDDIFMASCSLAMRKSVVEGFT